MSISITFSNFQSGTIKPKAKADTAIIGIYKDKRLSASAEVVDTAMEGYINHHLNAQKKFKGGKGQILTLAAPKDSDFTRIVLFGMGDAGKLEAIDCEEIGGKLFLALQAAGSEKAVLFDKDDQGREKLDSSLFAAHILMGMRLRSYKFSKYKDEKGGESDTDIAVEVMTDHAKQAADLHGTMEAIADGVFFARDLVNEPPNKLYPELFAHRIRDELKPMGVDVDIFDDKKMKKLGFHAHFEVGKGSENLPHVVIMQWNGGKKGDAPLAFVGKGRYQFEAVFRYFGNEA
jgi:leucyl aminopeptidase